MYDGVACKFVPHLYMISCSDVQFLQFQNLNFAFPLAKIGYYLFTDVYRQHQDILFSIAIVHVHDKSVMVNSAMYIVLVYNI